MTDEKVIDSSSAKKKKAKLSTENQEKTQLGQSLKILKVINFLYSNQDLISNNGVRFIMKAQTNDDEGWNA